MSSRAVADRSDDLSSSPSFPDIHELIDSAMEQQQHDDATGASASAGMGASPLPLPALPLPSPSPSPAASPSHREDERITDALLQIQATSSPTSALDSPSDEQTADGTDAGSTVVLHTRAASPAPLAAASSAVPAVSPLNRHGITPLPLSSITAAASHGRHASSTTLNAVSPPRHDKRHPSDGGGGSAGGGGGGGTLFLPPVQIHGAPASGGHHTRGFSRQMQLHGATLAPSAAGSATSSRGPSRPTSAHRPDQPTGRLGAGPSELPDGLNSWRGTRAGPIPLTGGAVVMSSGSGAINLAEALFNKLGLSSAAGTGEQSRRGSLNRDAALEASPPNTGRRVQISSAVMSQDESKVELSRLRSHGSDAGTGSVNGATASAAAAAAASAGAASAAAAGGNVTARTGSERRLQLDDRLPLARRPTFGAHLHGGSSSGIGIGGGGSGGGSGGVSGNARMIPLGRVGTLRQLALNGDSEHGSHTHTHTKSKAGSRRSSKLSNGSSDRFGSEEDPAADPAQQDIEGLDEADARTAGSPLGDGESVDGDAAILAAIEARRNEKKPVSALGIAVLGWIDGGWGTLVMTVATIFCLFGDDIRLMALDPSADLTFVVLSVICLVLFSAEFAAFCRWREGYAWTFFFFLDIVAVFSLIPDLPFIWEPFMTSIGQSAAEKQNLAVARAGRASRAGTRAGRLVRFIRLVRFLRLGKLYKLCGETEEERLKREAQEKAEETERARQEAEEKLIAEMDSDIGKGFSDYITKCVIIMVLFLMFLLPLLELAEEDTTPALFVTQVDNVMDGAVAVLRAEAAGESVPEGYSDLYPHAPELVAELVQRYLDHFGSRVVHFYLQAPGPSYLSDPLNVTSLHAWHDSEALGNLRPNEVEKTSGRWVSIWVDVGSARRSEALFSLCTTIFVTLLLGGGAALFSKDAHQMVILPIERMFLFVVRLAANPLGKILPTQDADQPFETRLLESTFMKLAGLLQIGFGAAGAEVISHNMQGDFLDPMVPGRKIFAIFGFCDVRRFGAVTEALGQHVMIFVNQVADIVHEYTHSYGGAANKNIGSAFLLVWKPTVAQLRRINAQKEQAALASASGGASADPALVLAPGESALGAALSAGAGFTSATGGGNAAHGREKYANAIGVGAHHHTHTIAEGDNENEESIALRRVSAASAAAAAMTGRNSRRPTLLLAAPPAIKEEHRDKDGKEQWAQRTPRKEQVLNEATAAAAAAGGRALVAPIPIAEHGRRNSSSSSSSSSSPSSRARRRRSSQRAIVAAAAAAAEENNINIPCGDGSGHEGSGSDSVASVGSGGGAAPLAHAHTHGGSFVSTATTVTATATETDTASSRALALANSSSASSFLPALTQPRHGAGASGTHAAARLTLPAHLVPRGSVSVANHFQTQTAHAESSSLHPSDFLSHENGVEAEFSELGGGGGGGGEANGHGHGHGLLKKRASGVAAWDGTKSDSPSQLHQRHVAEGIASNSSVRGSLSLGSGSAIAVSPAPAVAAGSTPQVPGGRRGSGIAAELIPAAIPEVSKSRAEEVESQSRAAPPQQQPQSSQPPQQGGSNTLQVHMALPPGTVDTTASAPSSAPSSAPGTPHLHALQPPPSPGLSALSGGDDAMPAHIARNASLAVGAGETRSGPLWEAMKHLADQAMVAFLSTIREVALTQELAHWRSNPSMAKLLGGGLGPGGAAQYEVDMGFGLHVGWAIEGAIGSIYKIDASYLSPNVNIASRLCGASKQYGVRLLMSGPLFSLLQPEIQKRCRHLDRITVKGSKLPLDVYTFDVGAMALRPPTSAASPEGSGCATPVVHLGEGGDDASAGAAAMGRPSTPPVSAVSSSALLMPPLHHHHVLDLPRSSAIQLSAVATREPGSSLTDDADIEVDDANNPLPRAANSSRAHALRLQEQSERLQARTARRRSNPTAVSNSSKKAVNSIAAVMAGLKKEPAQAADGRVHVAPLRPLGLGLGKGGSNRVLPLESGEASSSANLTLALAAPPLDPMVELQALSSVKTLAPPQGASGSAAASRAPSASSSPAGSPRPSRPTSAARPAATTTAAAAASGTSAAAAATAAVAAVQTSPTNASGDKTPKPKVESGDHAPSSLAAICAQLQEGLPGGSDFVRHFNAGTHYYIVGKWARARDTLEKKVLRLAPDDKPARVLLDFMAEHKFKAPKDWPGYRALTSK